MPDALSIAPSKNESVWAITAMFSSVAPGNTPQTVRGLEPGPQLAPRDGNGSPATDSRSIIWRITVPSWLPSMKIGMRAGGCVPAAVGSLMTLPGKPRTMNSAAAPSSSARLTTPQVSAVFSRPPGFGKAACDHRLAAHVAPVGSPPPCPFRPTPARDSSAPSRPDRAIERKRGLHRDRLCPARAVTSQDVGHHCSGRSVNSCTRVSSPMRLNCAATQSVVIVS